jgi:hypothetical protein
MHQVLWLMLLVWMGAMATVMDALSEQMPMKLSKHLPLLHMQKSLSSWYFVMYAYVSIAQH